jgi:hypothetical protein
MFAAIVKSIFCGLAAFVAAIFFGLFAMVLAGFYFAAEKSRPGDGVVGWDIVSLFHNTPRAILFLPLLIFAVGFLLGFQHFSKSLASK